MTLPSYPHFKFQIGQFVQSSFVALQQQTMRMNSQQILRDTFQIVERIYQECPGGIQLHYTVRPLGMFGSDRNYIRFNEIELAHIQQTETEGGEGT